MSKTILGVDISKDTFDVVLFFEGKKAKHKIFTNNLEGFKKLKTWLSKTTVHACMEATGTYGYELAEYLYELGHTVSVVNPYKVKKFMESELSDTKTDKQDALLIAKFCKEKNPQPWTPPSPEARKLKELVHLREGLIKVLVQERNRLSSGKLDQEVAALIKEHISFLEQKLKLLKARIEQHIAEYTDLKNKNELLLSIPGIGEITAALLLSEIPPLDQFQKARQLAKFAGLAPKIKKSGTSISGKSRLSKMGSSLIRKALYLPAMAAKKSNPNLKEFYERLLKAGKCKMSALGAVMRKLLHIVFGVLKSNRPFDPNFRTPVA
jgi:transposase